MKPKSLKCIYKDYY